ncbi:MAG TPA: MauE/DoxX family redox-associated membrane protein [Acidimicrobiales bacterium]|nr:MauE/DoxX family redox-associated membrane protein [Acidimicrobiales bacterium]
MSVATLLLATAGWTLVWSAVGHLGDLTDLSEMLRNHGLVRPVSVVLPVLVTAEIGLGVAAVGAPVVAPGARGAQAGLAVALTALFTVFAGYLAALRRRDPTQRCGCGGRGTASRAAVGRALALAGCSVTAGVLTLTGAGPGPDGIDASTLVVLAAAGAAGYLVLHGPEATRLEART